MLRIQNQQLPHLTLDHAYLETIQLVPELEECTSIRNQHRPKLIFVKKKRNKIIQ